MKPAAAIQALEDLKGEAGDTGALYRDSAAAESWKGRARSVVVRSLGAGHDLVAKLDQNIYGLGVFTNTTPDWEFQAAFAEGVNRACGYLDAAIYELRFDVDDLDVDSEEGL